MTWRLDRENGWGGERLKGMAPVLWPWGISDLPSFLGVPARNDDSCHQVFPVSVTHLLEEAGCRVYQRRLIQLNTRG